MEELKGKGLYKGLLVRSALRRQRTKELLASALEGRPDVEELQAWHHP